MHLQDCIRYDCTYSKYTMNNDGWSERVGPSNKIASWGINTRRKMSGGKKKNHNRGYYKQIKEKKLLDQRWEETAEGSITWIRSSIHRSDWIGGENPGSGSDTTSNLEILIFRSQTEGKKSYLWEAFRQNRERCGRICFCQRRGCSTTCLCSIYSLNHWSCNYMHLEEPAAEVLHI